MTLACAGAASESCGGTLAATTTEHETSGKVTAVSAKARKPKRTKHLVTVGSTSYALSGGTTEQLTITLNGTGRRLLSKFHKLPAEVELTPAGATAPAMTQAVTIRAAKPKHKRHH